MRLRNLVRSQSPLDRIGRQLGRLSKVVPTVLDILPRDTERLVSSEGKGYIFCGPRHCIPRGKHFAYFWIKVGKDVVSPRVVFDAVSWQGDTPTTVGRVTGGLTAGPNRLAVFVLCFELPESGQVEVRAWSDTNGNELRVGRIEIRRLEEWQLSMQGEVEIAPPTGPRWFKRSNPGSFEAILQRRPAERGKNLPSEMWLAFRPVEGSIHIQAEPTSGSSLLIELAATTKSQQFALKDGRSLLFVPLPFEGRQIRDNHIAVSLNRRQIKVAVQREMIDSQLKVSSRIAHPSLLRATGAADVNARGAAVRLRLWGLDEILSPPPIKGWSGFGEPRKEFVELEENVTTEFAASRSGFFLFETGPDCGITDLAWGPLRCHINLLEPSPGAMIIFVPDDLVQADAGTRTVTLSARQRSDDRQSGANTINIMALGQKHLASQSTEVTIENLWRNYPVEKIPPDDIGFKGDSEMRYGEIVALRGAARIWAGDVPAVQLVKHDYGGLCAVGYRNRLLVIDLYAPERERVLVLPSAPEPILSAHAQSALNGDEIVHPALAHLFRRMRPSWLTRHPLPLRDPS